MPPKPSRDDDPDFGESEVCQPDYLVRVITCYHVQDGFQSDRTIHETIDIRSEPLWRALREKGAAVIGACIV